ncbi:DUF6497 family protein [Sulfitobacter sp. MF3-043]|uniref:DUF6497 family protein n=1 Tax=Sulfitobacter sediminivivens TaxID=3252902 RepID=UPI0036DC70AF
MTKIPTRYRRFTDGISACLFAIALTATPAFAIDVPSGQPVELQEVLVDEVDGQIWLRFRFVAPEIARDGGSIDNEAAAPDMIHLCTSVALPYITQYDLDGQIIVVSLADRVTEFGVPDPDATQFFEAFRAEGDTCIWEGL